ncbi:pilus assembly PilX family protein [Thermomonas fusca]|uniref:pilus assembly PilX family protein n=1 Tax=Thermomonas fusca TaxID=215690 RepID=UPI00048C3B40|nr:PilX N-terminal domain-containing pilus assembly protein [Thermomonas fusca]
MSRFPSFSVAHRQRGISLLVVLLLLVVMSVLGVAVLRSSAMQERMSANLRDRSLATQAVEAALMTARANLAAAPKWRTAVPAAADCASDGVCPSYTSEANAGWRNGPTLGGVATQYWIEYLGENTTAMETTGVIPGSETTNRGPMFRITARSSSVGRALVVLQSDVIYRNPKL